MSSPLVAPLAAALGAAAIVLALTMREAPVLSSLVPVSATSRLAWIERLGSVAAVRVAVGASRLERLLASGRVAMPVDRIAGTAALASAILCVACLAVGGPVVLLMPLLAGGAVRVPVLLAAGSGRRRRRVIERDVPLLLDVLSLATFAGLPAPVALRRAVSVLDGPLAEELSSALADVDLGARWRDRLARVADELQVPELRRAVTMLRRTESIGVRSAEPIAILADEVRAARRAAASERARKAPVQMLFPLVFLILPAFLLLTVVPVLVATLGSIR